VFLLLSLIFVGWLGLSTANEEQSQRKQTLTIGRVSSNPGKHIKQIQPLADYVLSKIGDLGINKVEIIFARNNEEMINLIKTGKVDWISETVYSSLIFEEQAQTRIFLKRWKKNNAEYYSVFFTRKDSSINNLEQLAGKTLVLEDKGSTSGFFLPVTELIQKKFQQSIWIPLKTLYLKIRLATFLPKMKSILLHGFLKDMPMQAPLVMSTGPLIKKHPQV
jgi:phosphonate transport system substrate-binding protein